MCFSISAWRRNTVCCRWQLPARWRDGRWPCMHCCVCARYTSLGQAQSCRDTADIGPGLAGLAAYLVWLLSDNMLWLRVATQAGLWLFLLPLFASVGHRMIPFSPSARCQNCRWPGELAVVGDTCRKCGTCAAAAGRCGLMAMAERCTDDRRCILLELFMGISPQLQEPVARGVARRFCVGRYRDAALHGAKRCAILQSRHPVYPGLAPLHALTIGCFATLTIAWARA